MSALLGQLAVHSGHLSLDQLAEATQLQARESDGRMLGQILIELGHLDFDQLNDVLSRQQRYLGRGANLEGPLDLSMLTPMPDGQPGGALLRLPTPPGISPPMTSLPPLPSLPRPPGLMPSRAGMMIKRKKRPSSDPLEICLREAVALGASDIHAHAEAPLRIRLNGRLARFGADPIPTEQLESLLMAMLGPRETARLDADGQVGFVHHIHDVGRFRANIYRQLRGLDAVFRPIRPEPPALSDLGLPPGLARLTNFREGLVLITGPSGSGKTATLAALVDVLNRERQVHVLCIEDPVECLFPSRRAFISQRQIGRDAKSWGRAARAAMREDPDVLVLGELREPETIALAVSAAETGHLVMATMNAAGLESAINRLLAAYPASEERKARNMLADCLRAVITQRLVNSAREESRLAAHGVVTINPAIGNLIRDNKLHQLRGAIQTSASEGNRLIDESLERLVQTGRITRDEALQHASEPARFLQTTQG